MSNLSSPFVSIIIPVFNDSERLKTCLEALENQTYSKNLYEVIVVDNGSDEDIESVVNHFTQAVVAFESCPGSYAARNKGISVTKGDVLAFTDADCIPAPNWLEKGVANLLSIPQCGLVAGKIEFFFKDPNRPTAVELYDAHMIGLPQQKFIEKWRYGATANLFTFKRVVEDVGYFDDTLKSSGDKEWGQRVFAAGYKQTYADDTCVAHPARYFLSQLQKKLTRLTGGKQDLKRRRGYQFRGFIEDLTKNLLPPLRAYFRIWSDEKLQGNKQKIQIISVMLLVRHLRVWELVRLQLGGKSTRG